MAASIDTTHKRLYVSGIPTDQNNFQQLSEHFKQFGTISKIIISYHGKPDSALVTFASHNEANLAMNSPQAVFGNAGIQVRWGIRSKQTSTSQQTSLSSPLSSSSSSSSPSNTSKTTFQCEKCTKILATKRTLQNHMRQMHGEFRCQVCSTVFESGNEYLRHYNSMHSDSKDFARHFGDSNGSVRNNANMNFHPEHVMETLRRENCSLIKKVKKHKKNKSKMDKKLQERLVKLLEEKTERQAELETIRQKNNDLTQKLDEEKKAKLAEVATCTTMKANYDQLQQEKMQLSQRLCNEQMKVEMLRNTIAVMCKQR